MKRNYLIVGGIAIIMVAAIVVAIINMNKLTYRIEVSIVDDHSPDRILTVYNNKNEKVEVKRIEYSDGILLCSGYNMTVHFGDIKDEKEFNIVLQDGSYAKAKIVEKEVK